MEFNPSKFFKNRAEQSALKAAIKNKIKNFEENLSYAKIDHKKPPFEMYRGINSDQLIALRQAVKGFGTYEIDKKPNLELSKKVLEIFNEINKIVNIFLEISEPEKMEKMFEKSDIGKFDKEKPKEPYVIEPMASQITDSMEKLWFQIHELKSLIF